MVLELPGWWPVGKASGEGLRVGDAGSGDGEGVRANGDNGMWPTDLRRPGECRLLAAECSLCLRPCSVDGRWKCDGASTVAGVAGLIGDNEPGDDDCDDVLGESGDEKKRPVGGERGAALVAGDDAGRASLRLRVNDWKLRLGVIGDDAPAAI